jgi:hypothetical protein
MRILLLSLACLGVINAFSQATATSSLSAVVVGPDSLPVPDVAIINTRTFHTVRTNENGYFQTEIAENDSLFIHHIAFKRKFANHSHNGKIIVLEAQVNELQQVDVTDDAIQEMKNLQKTMEDIKRMAPQKKYSHSDFTDGSRQKNFVERHGSHTKGFMPFFGPTVQVPLGTIINAIGGNVDKRQRKKLTSHYHLVKRKDLEKEK